MISDRAVTPREVGGRRRLSWTSGDAGAWRFVVCAADGLSTCSFFFRAAHPGGMAIRSGQRPADLLHRRPGQTNFPTTTPSIAANSLFWPAVGSRSSTRSWPRSLLIGHRPRPGPPRAATGARWVGSCARASCIPGAVGLATASLLFWGLYSGSIGPDQPAAGGHQQPGHRAGPITSPVRSASSARRPRPAVDDGPDRLEVRGLLHDHPAGRPAGDPARPVRGGGDRWRQSLADLPARSRFRCCGRRWPCA